MFFPPCESRLHSLVSFCARVVKLIWAKSSFVLIKLNCWYQMWCARMQPFYDTCQEFKREALLKLGRSGSVIRGIGRLKPILRYQIVPAFSPSIAYFLSERKEPLNGFRFYGIKAWDQLASVGEALATHIEELLRI